MLKTFQPKTANMIIKSKMNWISIKICVVKTDLSKFSQSVKTQLNTKFYPSPTKVSLFKY